MSILALLWPSPIRRLTLSAFPCSRFRSSPAADLSPGGLGRPLRRRSRPVPGRNRPVHAGREKSPRRSQNSLRGPLRPDNRPPRPRPVNRPGEDSYSLPRPRMTSLTLLPAPRVRLRDGPGREDSHFFCGGGRWMSEKLPPRGPGRRPPRPDSLGSTCGPGPPLDGGPLTGYTTDTIRLWGSIGVTAVLLSGPIQDLRLGGGTLCCEEVLSLCWS
jgi:hypothetical protein